MINVAVAGAMGKMGREVVKAVSGDDDLRLSGCVDLCAVGHEILHPVSGDPVLGRVDELDPQGLDVLVDFTVADAARDDITWAIENGVHAVVGTTGLSESFLSEIRDRVEAANTNVLIASNFAIGAIMMMKLSEIAAKVFDQCEIIEYHHRQKVDAPSGTSIATANRIADQMNAVPVPPATEGNVSGARGGELGPVQIHSVRLDGYVAHQEVIFGAPGQTLAIRHDSIDRSCYMPGVVLAVKAVSGLRGLTIGIDDLL